MVVFGEAFSSGGESAALPVCESVHGFAGLSDIVGSATSESLGHHTGIFRGRTSRSWPPLS